MSEPDREPTPRPGVLWLIRGLGPGGAERLLVASAQAADHQGFAISAAYLVPTSDALVSDLQATGVKVTCLEALRRRDLRWALRLRRLLRSNPVEIVHAHSPLAASISRLVARTLPRGVRPLCVSTEHNLWAAYARATRWVNAVTLPLAAHHFAVSEEVRVAMPRRSRARTETLVHGIDLKRTRHEAGDRGEQRRDLGLVDTNVMALTVANYREKKDYPTLFKAARLALDAVPSLHWFIVGQGPLEAEINDLDRQFGVGGRLTVLGHRTDVPGLLAAADLFVLASRHEGLPVSVMEAFALGVPVVAPAVGGLRDAVRDGRDGLLVPPARPDLLADGVRRLADDPTLRGRMAQAAAASAERFDSTRTQRRIEEVYRALLTDAGP